ncbi:MAG: S8 family serine peptidase [Candidatus Cyclobacteriaceae bacterium M3_2C_046]
MKNFLSKKIWLYLLTTIWLSSTGQLMAQSNPSLKNRLPQASPKQMIDPTARTKPTDGRADKVSSVLRGLHQEHQQLGPGQTWLEYARQMGYDQTLILSQEKVIIEAVAENNTRELEAKLYSLGLQQASVYGRMVSGLFPISQIEQLGGLSNLRFVRAGYRPKIKVGATTSQGDRAQGTELAKTVCDIDGTGQKVGILSDSYNSLSGEAAGIASGDLPGSGNPEGYTTPVVNLSDLPPGFGSDEGRAMAELVHDVAPGSNLAFHTAFTGQAGFANGILRLAFEAGSDVIVDDVIYFAEPMFQDGIIAQAADIVQQTGVSYFSSAGNNARQSYESDFRPSPEPKRVTNADGLLLGDYILHDFDPGPGEDYFQKISISPFDDNIISLQWSQAFASICPTSPGADSDLDLIIALKEGDFTSAYLWSAEFNIGLDPVEITGFVNGDFPVEAYIMVGKWVGIPEFDIVPEGPNPDPEKIKYVYFGNELNEEYATNSGSTYGHANAAGAIAVGAVPYFNSPAFGSTSPLLEPFSSAGGTPILLDPCGTPISPEIREKPEICAPDGTNTTFFGFDIEDDGFPNFFGTSAAAPHAAGIAALMGQASPSLDPEGIEELLISTALDMDDPETPGFDSGFDFGTGYGYVQGFEALSHLTTCIGIATLELYNPETNQLIQSIDDGDQFSLEQLGTNKLAIKAVTVPEMVGSVKFDLKGALKHKQTENIVPYSLFGDRNGDLEGEAFIFGSFEPEVYQLDVTVYAESRGRGKVLDQYSLSFSLVQEPLQYFTLINSALDQEIYPLENFQIINLSETGLQLNVKAETGQDASIGSVYFELIETDLDQNPLATLARRTENVPPFALFGNTGEDYYDGTFTEGFYQLNATPYSKARRKGLEGPTLSIYFAVSDDGLLPDATTIAKDLSKNQEQNMDTFSFVVFPNPLDDHSNTIGVMFKDEEPISSDQTSVTYRLLNNLGEEIFSQTRKAEHPNDIYRMDIRSLRLSPGFYYLKVESPHRKPEITRLLKQ